MRRVGGHSRSFDQQPQSSALAALEASVAHQEVERADEIFAELKAAGRADVLAYNLTIKVHLHFDHYDYAKSLLEEMRKSDVMPTLATYNEMIAGFARSRYPPRKRYIWRIVDQMRSEGFEPNCHTCSIILKHVQETSPHIEVARALELAESLSMPMDEVLMASIVEACVRMNKPNLAAEKLKELHVDRGIEATTCSTYGSLIKGYGFVGNADEVWRCWHRMREQRVPLTAITISCMVEAVANGGDLQGARALVMGMVNDPSTRNLIDAWSYGLLLKGFGKNKDIDSVTELFQDMLSRGIKPNTVTYNILIDVCTRNDSADRAPEFLEQMRDRGCEPNLITYSTMINGYCHQNDMEKAMGVLESLKRHPKVKPDEVVYKTLINGFADKGKVHEAKALMFEMQAQGFSISGGVLARVVRLLGRVGRLEECFELAGPETSRRQSKIKLGAGATNALMEACLYNKEWKRAAQLCMQMVREHVELEPPIFQELVTTLIESGAAKQAVGLLSMTIKPSHPRVPDASPAVLAAWRNLLPNSCPVDQKFIGEILAKIAAQGGEDAFRLAQSLLSMVRCCRPELVPDAPPATCVAGA